MSKHTPGQWEQKHVTPRITRIVSNTEPESVIAIIDVPEYGSKIANTRLIAAAPELLDALQTLIPWIEQTGIADSDPPEYLQALAAIRKATGE